MFFKSIKPLSFVLAQGACWVAVESHNKERAYYHDKKVTWSNALAAKATDLNQGCEFKHKSTGENLYWTSVNNVEDATRWENELGCITIEEGPQVRWSN